MELIFFLLPAALLLGAVALFGFVWAARSGQFDDLETPQRRMLFDEDEDDLRDKKPQSLK